MDHSVFDKRLHEEVSQLSPIKKALLQKLLLQKAAREFELKPIPKRHAGCTVPLSSAQKRLWFLDQLMPGKASFNVPTALRLKGPLDAQVLEQSLNELIKRHEVLRTRFESVGGHPVQKIEPSLTMRIPVVDLSEMAEADRESEATRLTNEEIHRPFDLKQAPLLRSSLLRLGCEDHIFVATIHHIVTDGWSMVIFTQELTAIYEARVKGMPSPLKELPIQYGDYAYWQQEWMSREGLDNLLSYWREKLSGAPELIKLRTDRPRPSVQTSRGAMLSRVQSKELTQALKSLCHREGVTLFILLLAVFKVLLRHYSNQDDIVVGTNIANRNRVETEGLIGFFINQIVLRTVFSGDPSFRQILAQVRETALGAFAHQDMPFEKLVEELQPGRSLSYSPISQVKIEFQDVVTPAHSTVSLIPKGLETSMVSVESSVIRYDLHLFLLDTDHGLVTSLGYSADLFNPDTVAQMIDQFQILLETVVDQPNIVLNALEQKMIEMERQLKIAAEKQLAETSVRKLEMVKRKTIVKKTC